MLGPLFASPVLVGKHVYCIGPANRMFCVEARTGAGGWVEDRFFSGMTDAGFASFLVAGQNLLTNKTRASAVQTMAESGAAHPQFEAPYGPLVASNYALIAQRHMYEYGTTAEQMAEVAVTIRKHALATKALLRGELNSRVPSTLLIAIGAFIPTVTDSLNKLGSTELYELGKLLGVCFLFAGFLVSTEVFHEIRVPFTGIVLRTRSRHPGATGRP